jgi:hypothetical protein
LQQQLKRMGTNTAYRPWAWSVYMFTPFFFLLRKVNQIVQFFKYKSKGRFLFCDLCGTNGFTRWSKDLLVKALFLPTTKAVGSFLGNYRL